MIYDIFFFFSSRRRHTRCLSDWSSDVCSSDLIECLRLAKSGQVLVCTQKANTPARCGWNADRAQPFLVIAARDASRVRENVEKKRTGFGPHPESEHPGQTRLECRSGTAISCDSRERRKQHFRRPAEKADRFWSAPRKRTPRPDAAGMPIAHSHFL